LYRENLSRLKRLVLSDELPAWSALPSNVGMCHPDLELVSIERCHGFKAFDFRRRANASPRPEPPLAIRLVDCAAVESITLFTERHCAKGLEFRGLPNCKQVQISTPDLEDLRSLVELGSVESLVVQNCPRLRSLDGIASLTRLTSLTLANCPELASVAGVEALARLSQLSLNDCGKLASLDALAAMPELAYIELQGATSIKSLHGYHSRDGVSFFIESEGVGVPPSLVKTYFDNDGANCLGHFEKAIIECASCGGTKFRGGCHGWYERVHFAEVERCGALAGDDLVSSSKRQLAALEAELRSDGLEGVEGARGQDLFPVLHADVTCVTCKAILDPASIGARPEMDGNWSEVGKERSIKGIAQPKPEIRLEFDVARPEGEHVGHEAGKCPICCEAVLQIAVNGVARSESGGKFSGHVEIDRDTWSDLPECFHIDESNEKADGAWRWARAPRAASGGHVTCERGCFRAFVAAPEQVPAVLLAVLAAFETNQTAPDVARLATWFRGLGSDADSPASLVKAAVAHLEALDPEMVPSESPDADPVELANACRQKAKALMEQALPEAMKAPAATRTKRPSAKKAAKSAPAKKGASKKSSAASAAVAVPPSQGLQGRVFCFTGRLMGMSRAEAEAKVVALGAKTADSITKKVTDVFVGEGAGSKREKAEKLGLRVLDQAAFEELFQGSAGTTGATASPKSLAGGMPSDGAVPKGGSWAVLQAAGFAMSDGAQMDAKWHVPDSIVHVQTGATMLLIHPGEFLMGSPESEAERRDDEVQHRRVIRKPFYLGKTAVTQAEWRKVMGSNPGSFKGEDLPVDMVSWDDCQVFLKKAGGGMRLPSEAEWEYACRAGTTTTFSFGATITPEQVNYDGNGPYGGASEGLNRKRPVAVGSLPANAWGLHEMHGNGMEWCQDGYGDYPSSGTEEPSRDAGERVLRGGSWLRTASGCRAARRVRFEPGLRDINLGLRLARTLPE
jgi:formylglycine-generating enzyme required for sulfatase activity